MHAGQCRGLLLALKGPFLSLVPTFLPPRRETLCASQPRVSVTDSREQFY